MPKYLTDEQRDPVLRILNDMLEAYAPFQEPFPSEIIPVGRLIGNYHLGRVYESLFETRIHGVPYILVLGWNKHEPYALLTVENDWSEDFRCEDAA